MVNQEFFDNRYLVHIIKSDLDVFSISFESIDLPPTIFSSLSWIKLLEQPLMVIVGNT
jgi:hypothetical protein